MDILGSQPLMTGSAALSGGIGAVTGDAATLQDLTRNSTADLETQLADDRSLLDDYWKDEKQYKQNSDKMLKRLDSLARKDNLLKKTEPKLRYSAMPTPIIIGLGAVMHCPVVAAVGAAVLLGSFAAKKYIQMAIPKIDKAFWPLKTKYELSLNNMQNLQEARHELEKEISTLEARIKNIGDEAAATVKSAERLDSGQLSGAASIVDDDEFLDIDGMRMRKRSDKEDAVFNLAQARMKYLKQE